MFHDFHSVSRMMDREPEVRPRMTLTPQSSTAIETRQPSTTTDSPVAMTMVKPKRISARSTWWENQLERAYERQQDKQEEEHYMFLHNDPDQRY